MENYVPITLAHQNKAKQIVHLLTTLQESIFLLVIYGGLL